MMSLILKLHLMIPVLVTLKTNLSKRNLSENEISLLSKGHNFIPPCKKVDVARLKLE